MVLYYRLRFSKGGHGIAIYGMMWKEREIEREREMERVQVHVGYTFTHYCIALGQSISLDTHVANGKW